MIGCRVLCFFKYWLDVLRHLCVRFLKLILSCPVLTIMMKRRLDSSMFQRPSISLDIRFLFTYVGQMHNEKKRRGKHRRFYTSFQFFFNGLVCFYHTFINVFLPFLRVLIVVQQSFKNNFFRIEWKNSSSSKSTSISRGLLVMTLSSDKKSRSDHCFFRFWLCRLRTCWNDVLNTD